MTIKALISPLRELRVGLRAPLRFLSTTQTLARETPKPEVDKPRHGIETLTMELLQGTLSSEKKRPAAVEATLRYQKIHQVGDVYHPEDLNDVRYQEQVRQRLKRPTPLEDQFNLLDLNPLHEYKNVRLLSHFVTTMGRIMPREQTGLTAKNQRKLAKAIRRARAMGLMSCTNKLQSQNMRSQF